MDEFIVCKYGTTTKFYKCDKKVQRLYNKDVLGYYCLHKNEWVKKGLCLGCKYKKEV